MRRRNVAAFAPQAPMPTEPGICRWCRGRLRQVLLSEPVFDYCEAGCARNDMAPFLRHCQECGREFHTGRRLLSSLCCECDASERASTTMPSGSRVYSYKRYGRGRFID